MRCRPERGGTMPMPAGAAGGWAAWPQALPGPPCLPRICQRSPINRYSIVICSQGGLISQLAPPLSPWQQQRCQATAPPASAAPEQAGSVERQAPLLTCSPSPALQVPRTRGLGPPPARAHEAPPLSTLHRLQMAKVWPEPLLQETPCMELASWEGILSHGPPWTYS